MAHWRHRLGAAIVFATVGPGSADAGGRVLVPTVTIYPGDIVQAGRLREAEIDDDASGLISAPGEIEGKIARRTLLAGRPILRNWIDEPVAVANGSAVSLIYEEPGLTIRATGQALEPGRIGDAIRVRNADSGIVVVGSVRPDGAIRVAK